MTIARASLAPVAALALVVAALAGYQAAAPGLEPPVIASVRIQPLFDGLLERAEAKTQIEDLEAELLEEQSRRQRTITTFLEQLEQVVETEKRKEIQDQIELERLEMRFWLQEAAGELETEKALRLQFLYRHIKIAIRELAEAEGYDIVILDDAIEDPSFDRDSRVPAQVQVLQQITSRNILYLNATLDVTDDLIMRMNNAHRAAQAGP